MNISIFELRKISVGGPNIANYLFKIAHSVILICIEKIIKDKGTTEDSSSGSSVI